MAQLCARSTLRTLRSRLKYSLVTNTIWSSEERKKYIQNRQESITYKSITMVLAAIFQFCARQCVRDNALQCVSAIESAAGRGAKFIFLPEASDFIASGDAYKSLSESLETGQFMSSIRNAAKLHSMWVSVGVHEAGASQGRCFNTQVLVDDKGIIASLYRKIHLFDVKNVGPGNTPVLESASTEPGDRVVDPATTPIGRVGMLTCYDMRFPEVSLMLREKDADIITYPSSFTVKTGKAHWEVLLRARAIETQCYVVAAAQAGVHTYAGRTSYGRAMVVSPWGEIVAQLSECDSDPRPYNESEELPTKASELAYFDIDLDQLVKSGCVRRSVKDETSAREMERLIPRQDPKYRRR